MPPVRQVFGEDGVAHLMKRKRGDGFVYDLMPNRRGVDGIES